MEKYKKGGYSILDLESSTIYADSVKALDSNKPVVVYDGTNAPYFADTISLSGTSVVITKGGKTITINDTNSVSSEGVVANPTMENIVDLNGNKRFVEGEGTSLELSGVDIQYNRWSLSGTHLMLVVFGSVADTTVIPDPSILSKFVLPKYILDKIYPLVGIRVNWGTITLYANDYSYQTVTFIVNKVGDGLELRTNSALTLTADRTFRIQIDLLIDAE